MSDSPVSSEKIQSGGLAASPGTPGIRTATRGDKFIYAVAGLAFAAAFVFPFTAPSGFWMRTFTFVFMAAILAIGWNLIGGYTGYAAFGNVAFFGLGAYVTGILMTKTNLDFLPSLLAGGIFCAAFAAAVEPPLLRLRGHYFAVATLGLANAVQQIVAGWDPLTGGGIGLNLPISSDRNFFQFIYYVMLVILAAGTLATFFLSRHKLGYGWVAIRENEDAARALGVNTTWFKTIAFALAGLVIGLAGGTYAYYNTAITPDTVFDIVYTVNPILITVLGGAGTVLGPLVGALIFQILSTYLAFQFPGLQNTFLGITLILVIIFMPRGVLEYLTGRRTFGLMSLLQAPRENRA
jgi:branched-chain amino acid transport system permease protein